MQNTRREMSQVFLASLALLATAGAITALVLAALKELWARWRA